jgi:hypothetical protein
LASHTGAAAPTHPGAARQAHLCNIHGAICALMHCAPPVKGGAPRGSGDGWRLQSGISVKQQHGWPGVRACCAPSLATST